MSTPAPPPGAPPPKLQQVRRAFNSVAARLRAAKTHAEVEDELSNLLHQLYRLGELCRWRLAPAGAKLTPQAFGALLAAGSSDLRAARAALWVRTFDTHDLAAIDMATPSDTYGDRYSDTYGAVDWKPLTQTDPDGWDLDYAAELEGRPVLDTSRRAFNALAGLL
jgi:hypothetical protein